MDAMTEVDMDAKGDGACMENAWMECDQRHPCQRHPCQRPHASVSRPLPMAICLFKIYTSVFLYLLFSYFASLGQFFGGILETGLAEK